jgi:hypothetical protein
MSEGSGLSPGVLSSVSDKEQSGRVQACESYSLSSVSEPHLTDPRKRIFPSFFQRLTLTVTALGAAPKPARWRAIRNGVPRVKTHGPDSDFDAALRPEHHRVHDPAREQREEPCDHEGARENRDHGAAMLDDLTPVRAPDGEREHDQHEDR